jgi:hypothetical protein
MNVKITAQYSPKSLAEVSMHVNNIVVHTILTNCGGYFCLPAKVAPQCGNSVNTI